MSKRQKQLKSKPATHKVLFFFPSFFATHTTAVGDDGGFGTKVACNAFDEYLELSRRLSLADGLVPFEEKAFLSSGQYRGVQALEWWCTQRNVSQTRWLDQLSGVAAMMLSLPAGESHDEFVFSDTGRTFSKGRASLSHERLEQVTMITMLIRNFGWNPSTLSAWVAEVLQKNPQLLKGSTAPPGAPK